MVYVLGDLTAISDFFSVGDIKDNVTISRRQVLGVNIYITQLLIISDVYFTHFMQLLYNAKAYHIEIKL